MSTWKRSCDPQAVTVSDARLLFAQVVPAATKPDTRPVQNPAQRVIFHALVLFFGYGGFHQGMIMDKGSLRYRDIDVAVVRDPEDGKTKRLVATSTIGRNKLERNALEQSTRKEQRVLNPSPSSSVGILLISSSAIQAQLFYHSPADYSPLPCTTNCCSRHPNRCFLDKLPIC